MGGELLPGALSPVRPGTRRSAPGARPGVAVAVALGLGSLVLARPAGAHDGVPLEPHDLLRLEAWSFEPWVVLLLALSVWLYGRGVRRLWRESAPGRGIRRWEAGAFAAGWLALVAALVSPLHRMGTALFSAHMVQHEVLVVIAAPLVVLGRPLIPFLWALSPGWRRRLGGWAKVAPVRASWGALTAPLVAWVVHAVALWLWHLPALYEGTLGSELLHTAQHASFFGSALIFWWALVHGRERRMGYGAAVIYLFGTALHSGILGALLTFAEYPWYARYAGSVGAWGLTPIEDQQLAGLIMWVPAGLAYLAAALTLMAVWMREMETRGATPRPGSLLVLLATVSLAACDFGTEQRVTAKQASAMTGGDVARGRAAIRTYGCGSCHTIPGVSGANGLVGPPLAGIGKRVYVAGVLQNTPQNLVRWVSDPKAVDEKTAMPNLGVTERDARDIAAYLYTLK